MNRMASLALATILGLAAVSCAPKTINQLLADPSRYRDQTITVRGTVAQSASIAGRGA